MTDKPDANTEPDADTGPDGNQGPDANQGPDKLEKAEASSGCPKRRLGVFVCHCGGNISDYVDVDKVKETLAGEDDVVISKTHMFACSDASQQEMIDDIQAENLDGIVVASCSPKLHLFTFRAMSDRGGLNQYQYTQANIREQCSWAHQDDVARATEKATRIVRGAVAKTRLTEPLETLRVETKRKVLIIGAGVAGLSAALHLAEMGLAVVVVEQAEEVGGWTRQWGKLFPNGRTGQATIDEVFAKVKAEEQITVFTGAEVVEKAGTVGDFDIKIRVEDGSTVSVTVGAIVVATGFDPYQPGEGEYGFGEKRVVTLPEFEALLREGSGPLLFEGKPVRSIGYVYCVGSRQSEDCGLEKPNTYCSRFCCTAAVNAAVRAHARDPDLNQVHLYRDMRTYGKYELIYEEAARKGSVFLRFGPDAPPTVRPEGSQLILEVEDALDAGEPLEIPVDLVVLVTGMVPRENASLVDVLKLPVGIDGFFNEIHPKLRPVETTIDGVFIAGASQGPKTVSESVASSLAAVSKSAALVMKGFVDLDPFIATINTDACTGCNDCIDACPYGAIETIRIDGEAKAKVTAALCKGGGACVPVCPENALDLKGYTDAQVKSEIDALMEEVA